MKVAFYQEIYIGDLDIPDDIMEQGEAAIYKYAEQNDKALDKAIVIDSSYLQLS